MRRLSRSLVGALALLMAVLLGSAAARAETDPASPAALRDLALTLLNADRAKQGLPPMRPTETLSRAAQAHADDMAARHYLAHVSPDGRTAFDRYTAVGGERWQAVAENIGFCSECGRQLSESDVRQMEQGWMTSPPHRENILSPGLNQFGFGIAADPDGKVYAVQTFAGPGNQDDAEERVTPDAQADRFFALLNRDRARLALPPVQQKASLIAAAVSALDGPNDPLKMGSLLEGIRRSLGQQWRSLATVIGICGGCGVDLTAADIDAFYTRWMNNPDYRAKLMDPEFVAAGFAMRANGSGRKVALSLLGAPAPSMVER